jgi:putative SOS response-associated peptidase YedK
MCGRYVVEGHQELSERFQLRQVPLWLPTTTTYNAAPSQDLPVIVEGEEGERAVRLMRWGLRPRWAKPGERAPVAPINARAETLFEKPMYRPLVKRRRCLVPAAGFYEWKREGGRKQPWFFAVKDEPLIAFAGLWDEAPGEGDGEPIASYAIVTTRPNEAVAPLHDRMPAILRPEHEAAWLVREELGPEEVGHLLAPYPADEMEARQVSPAVNRVGNDGPELIRPQA